MSWLSELKEQARAHIISLITGLIMLLLGVIWAVIPAEIWGRVSAAIPKRALWATLALLALTLLLETAYIAHLRRESKLKPHFGVLWNKARVPHCPACVSLLSNYGQYWSGYTSTWAFRC